MSDRARVSEPQPSRARARARATDQGNQQGDEAARRRDGHDSLRGGRHAHSPEFVGGIEGRAGRSVAHYQIHHSIIVHDREQHGSIQRLF